MAVVVVEVASRVLSAPSLAVSSSSAAPDQLVARTRLCIVPSHCRVSLRKEVTGERARSLIFFFLIEIVNGAWNDSENLRTCNFYNVCGCPPGDVVIDVDTTGDGLRHWLQENITEMQIMMDEKSFSLCDVKSPEHLQHYKSVSLTTLHYEDIFCFCRF